MKAKRSLAVFSLLLCLTVAFIFSQSMLDKQASAAQSGWVTAVLHQLLDPQGSIPAETFHHWIRKTAHFVEFAALGMVTLGFVWNLEILTQRSWQILKLYLPLAVAVADEYIQYFTGRGSQVTDVVLDYAGALTGLGAAWLLVLLLRKIKKANGLGG